jgi:DNA segregation ATPase FtsK/SpoIIIE, S-DNA-T family
MKILGPTRISRLNEVAAFVFLFAAVAFTLSLVSYHPTDPSWNAASGAVRPLNLIGYPGAFTADVCYQIFGLASFVFPVLLLALAWKWLRSQALEAQVIRVAGSSMFVLSICTALSFGPRWRLFGGVVAPGGLLGTLLAEYLVDAMNLTGAIMLTGIALIVSVYLVSTFEVAKLEQWFRGPIEWWQRVSARWRNWREERRQRHIEKARLKAEAKAAKAKEKEAKKPRRTKAPAVAGEELMPAALHCTGIPEDIAPWEDPPAEAEIPIHTIEDIAGNSTAQPTTTPLPDLLPTPVTAPVAASEAELQPLNRKPKPKTAPKRRMYDMPDTAMLHEAAARSAFDSQELKDTAARIKSKFEEFNVLGSVVQINPGPVVTTFEFKPEAGIKYSRITTLNEDLCLGLQAESVLIERIPGKPTVGIEVPNSKREVISLRQILESDEFRNQPSPLAIALGKDISGRIKVASMESMPHLLIAGSTGSGKSVMMNAMIMSVLYKSTPDEVRMIMVDPKRVELGMYEGIPHLLTPVITDPKKATYALRNAVLEMERRLKLLAALGVRNVDQYNKKVRQMQAQPMSLFEEDPEKVIDEPLQPLPLILIFIDELADLMMLERASVEEAITRLAQMARAVGMHLVVATQRPSVDVITGLIKANFPARISFRVATRVDSRTILDVMGSEHLLGKGDMLFLPPGSSRLVRVHGAFVTEAEINSVVEHWKAQAAPDYDQTFLTPPPSDDDNEAAEFEGEQDPLYEDALRVVLEQGKASTSTLQRRLRLGYGRAARILDMMQRDGVIGPPDGSKPREVLKRPDWMQEVEDTVR